MGGLTFPPPRFVMKFRRPCAFPFHGFGTPGFEPGTCSRCSDGSYRRFHPLSYVPLMRYLYDRRTIGLSRYALGISGFAQTDSNNPLLHLSRYALRYTMRKSVTCGVPQAFSAVLRDKRLNRLSSYLLRIVGTDGFEPSPTGL